MNEATPGEERPREAGTGRQIFDGAYARADRMLDHGQRRVFRLFWFFLPDTSIARDPAFEQVLASRFFSDAGQQALTYGALIAVVRGGGSAFQCALIGVAALVPPAIFALYGGTVADQLPKRVALAAIYNMQAALCIFVPLLFGTEFALVIFLIFAVNLLGQVSGPTESSVLPFIASEQQLASAASLVSLVSNIGTAFGTALLAPVLVRVWGEQAVFTAAGVMLLIAASRVFDLTTREREPEQRFDWRRRPAMNARATISWLAGERAVATMIFVAVLAGMASIVVLTLGPQYVQSVLHVDPADAVYVFAPTSAGLLAALTCAPRLVHRYGERIVALGGFAITTSVLLLFGLVDDVSGPIDSVNVLRLLEVFGIEMNQALRTAGFLSMFLGFGLALTQISVQTYINRRVPLSYQGRTFALQSMLKNGATIVPLLTLGAAATAFGVEAVLIAAPFVLLATAVGLVRLSYAFAGTSGGNRLDVLASYWEESEVPVTAPDQAREIDTSSTPA